MEPAEVATLPLFPDTVGREMFHAPVPGISPTVCPGSESLTGPEFKFVAIVGAFCRIFIKPNLTTFWFSLIA